MYTHTCVRAHMFVHPGMALIYTSAVDFLDELSPVPGATTVLTDPEVLQARGRMLSPSVHPLTLYVPLTPLTPPLHPITPSCVLKAMGGILAEPADDAGRGAVVQGGGGVSDVETSSGTQLYMLTL